MSGYYTGYSYCGFMPDGRRAYFATDKEYREAYMEELREQGLSFFAYFAMAYVKEVRKMRDEIEDLIGALNLALIIANGSNQDMISIPKEDALSILTILEGFKALV